MPSIIGRPIFSALLKFLIASSLNIFQSMVLTLFISYFIKMVSQKKRKILQTEYKLDNSFNFQWCQLIYALRESWKKSINLSNNSNNILLCTDYYITRKSRMITATELYINLISTTNCKPSFQICFDNLFQNNLSGCWNQIYILPCKVTLYNYMRCFQCKIINNILFLNKKLYIFGISETPLCSFSHTKEKTTFV